MTDLLPCFTVHGDDDSETLWRECWRCEYAYEENVAEDNEEARCPVCQASQALCENCGEPGAETCIREPAIDTDLCPACWPGRITFADLRRAYDLAVDSVKDNPGDGRTVRDYWAACVEETLADARQEGK